MKKGFTFQEILIVLAIIAVAVTIVLKVGIVFLYKVEASPASQQSTRLKLDYMIKNGITNDEGYFAKSYFETKKKDANESFDAEAYWGAVPADDPEEE